MLTHLHKQVLSRRARWLILCSAGRDPGDLAFIEPSADPTPGVEQRLLWTLEKGFSGVLHCEENSHTLMTERTLLMGNDFSLQSVEKFV